MVNSVLLGCVFSVGRRFVAGGSMWYSFEKDYVLSGWAHLKALGMPDDVDLTGLSEAELRCLAGEGFVRVFEILPHHL